jgi:hypothetical protein
LVQSGLQGGIGCQPMFSIDHWPAANATILAKDAIALFVISTVVEKSLTVSTFNWDER